MMSSTLGLQKNPNLVICVNQNDDEDDDGAVKIVLKKKSQWLRVQCDVSRYPTTQN